VWFRCRGCRVHWPIVCVCCDSTASTGLARRSLARHTSTSMASKTPSTKTTAACCPSWALTLPITHEHCYHWHSQNLHCKRPTTTQPHNHSTHERTQPNSKVKLAPVNPKGVLLCWLCLGAFMGPG
jgi:hypothetical protein